MTLDFEIVNYIKFLKDSTTSTIYKYHNFGVPNVNRTYNNETYNFLAFAVTSGTSKLSGDRSTTQVVVGLNQIVVNVFSESVKNRWFLDLKTVSLNVVDGSNEFLLRSELWRVSSYVLAVNQIALKLSSPLDAAESDVPRQVLTSKLVGALPSSGTLAVG